MLIVLKSYIFVAQASLSATVSYKSAYAGMYVKYNLLKMYSIIEKKVYVLQLRSKLIVYYKLLN